MAGLSDIEWTDATWNPVAGCRIVTAGCTNCYAMRMAARLEAMRVPLYAGTTRKSGTKYVWTGKINLNPKVLSQPARWKKPRRIFVNSMSDLFQDGVPEEFLLEVWAAMAAAPQHQFQILTKRPDRMSDFTSRKDVPVLSNVWLGTSIENVQVTKDRLRELRRANAAVKFVSFEPLLGPVGKMNLTGVDWAIVGGESGPKARPIETAWVDQIHAQCEAQGVAFFFKQWGGKNKKATGRVYRGKTWNEFPAQLSL